MTGFEKIRPMKGETPPVDGFWSLTLYNKEHLFASNPLNRFSLGTKSKSMKLGDDGSLTIYVQASSPGPEREANWLPAPKEDFSLYIRAYWPKAELTEGKWTPVPPSWLRNGRGKYMRSPEANNDQPPRELSVIQLREAKTKWRRRKPDAPLSDLI